MTKIRTTAVRAALVAAPTLFILIATAGAGWRSELKNLPRKADF